MVDPNQERWGFVRGALALMPGGPGGTLPSSPFAKSPGRAACAASWESAQERQLEPCSDLEAVNGEKSKVTAGPPTQLRFLP